MDTRCVSWTTSGHKMCVLDYVYVTTNHHEAYFQGFKMNYDPCERNLGEIMFVPSNKLLNKYVYLFQMFGS